MAFMVLSDINSVHHRLARGEDACAVRKCGRMPAACKMGSAAVLDLFYFFYLFG